jgi:hypothetical protein
VTFENGFFSSQAEGFRLHTRGMQPFRASMRTVDLVPRLARKPSDACSEAMARSNSRLARKSNTPNDPRAILVSLYIQNLPNYE